MLLFQPEIIETSLDEQYDSVYRAMEGLRNCYACFKIQGYFERTLKRQFARLIYQDLTNRGHAWSKEIGWHITRFDLEV